MFRFAGFELDENRRELRWGDREVVLQPRVFDLLLFLVRNRDRVVSKQEILDAVWHDVIVADSSVQRAVSLARSALAEGGVRDAIRTHARVGYRFVLDVDVGADGLDRGTIGEALGRARAAFEHEDWEAGAAGFRTADDEEGLDAADLERWAFAAQCAGRAAEAVPPLERAVAAHAAAGDRRGAARAAVLVAQIQIELRQGSVARGWLRRAERYLEGDVDSRARALLEWTRSRLALYEGRVDEALRSGERAHDIGERLGDPDLESLGLIYSAHAMVARGDLDRGLECQEEAAAAVLAGEVSPWAGGLVYCGVIWLCCALGDWHRASQWTEHFGRWCDDTGLSGFPGLCRLHRAELLSVRGELEQATAEVEDASELLASCAPWAEGDAYRVLGDIRLAQGELDRASEAYRRCHDLGWEPLPGSALLEAARGRPESGLRLLQRSLADTGFAAGQRRGLLLAHTVALAVAAADVETARLALAELDRHPELWANPSHRAEVEAARGELAAAEGRLGDAITHLRRAIRIRLETGFELAVAAARVRLAELLLADRDPAAAELERAAAEPVASRLGAAPLLERCRRLRVRLKAADGANRDGAGS